MFLDPSLLVRVAENATFNVAAEAPPMLQCNDIRHCRTLSSIIIGCFSTVFLCTWTALHLNLPYPSLLGRVGNMMIALFAPEAWFIQAYAEWADSPYLLKDILKNYPECGWTETHAQFVGMGGFCLVDANGKTFRDCVEDGTIDLPNVSKDEILARSKGDNISKIITVIHTAWFVFQCIHRRSQHLLLIELEITTLAHTLINFFIYFFWWHKPYGVVLPIEVPFKERRRPETIGGRDDKVESTGVSSDRNDNIQAPHAQSPISNEDSNRASEKGLPVATKSSDDRSPAVASNKKLKSDLEASSTPYWCIRLKFKSFSVYHQAQLFMLRPMVLNIIYFTIGGGFGAMHCLAWNSAFPTRAEQYTWQVSSLIVAVFGGTSLVWVIRMDELDRFLGGKGTTSEFVFSFFIFILVLMYCLARVSLLVLALLQLRSLPYAGYATPSWTIFYPHIG